MNTEQFFNAVLPSTGPYLVAIPVKWVKDGETCKGFRHFAFDTKADAAARAKALAFDPEAPQEVYFGLGSIKEVRKKKVRIKDNIKSLGAFWVDIDVRTDKPGNYTTFEAAAKAIRKFCVDCVLPKPTIVNSGGGFHVYWPLDDDIDRDQWEHYAGLLRGLASEHGLLVDTKRTCDCASVLRPAGTLNWKTGSPRSVEVAVDGGVLPKAKVMAAIADAAQQRNIQPSKPSIAAGLTIPGTNPAVNGSVASNDDAKAGAVEDVPSNAKRVVSKCQQLMAQAQSPAHVDEPSWYAMVGCLRFAENGEEAVHRMSRGYPGYSQVETDQKIQQHKDGGFGPSTCIAFENANPAGCEGCPHKGRITTPLQLGRERQALQAPQVNIQTSTGQKLSLTLPDPPHPFKRVALPTGDIAIVATVTAADDTDEDVPVYENDLYPSGLWFDERSSRYFATIRRYLPKDGWADFDVNIGSLFDKRNLAVTLGDMGVVPDLDKVELLVTYMLAYIKELQASAKSAVVYAKMGWKEDTMFVLPDRVVTRTADEPVSPGKNTINALRWREPQGDLNTWRAVAALYEKPGMESLQFGFGVGFAAPLFRFTNFDGMIVSMVGEKGCGKSSAALLANSIWGHTKLGWADSKHDTIRAFYNKLGVLNNLPATYDEITNLPAEDLSDLCYSVSKGEGRQRLNQDGSAKEDHGSWQTMMLTTSNASLHSRLTLAKADATAEAVRIFEYYVPSHTLPKATADDAFDKLNYHYGLAGPVYLRYVVDNLQAVKDRVRHWVRVIDKAAKVSSGERFWSAAPACILAGFEAANACGLTNADTQRLFQFAVNTIEKMRTNVASSVRGSFTLLTDYLTSSLHKTLTIGHEPKPGAPTLITQEPKGELRIRYEQWRERLFIDRADFRRYCAQASVDPAKVREELLTHGVLIEEKKHVLGKGTNFGRGQTMCWVLDMSSPVMSGPQTNLKSSSAGDVAANAISNAQQGGRAVKGGDD